MDVIATLNINLGLGSKNPSLKITKNTNISDMIKDFVKQYQLPSEAEKIIWSKIQAELTKEKVCLSPLPTKQTKKRKKTPHNKSISPLRTVSPIRQKNQPKSRQISLKRTPLKGKNKENVTDNINIKKTKTPVKKRYQKESEGEKGREQRIEKLFEKLMKNHPRTVKVLTPQFICFSGLNKQTLAVLRQFFSSINEEDYENLDLALFKAKMLELSFYERISKCLQ